MRDNSSLNFGWIIVGMSFVTLGLSYAIWYSFSVFFVALLKEFGWSRSIVAGSFSLFIIFHSIIGPFVGALADRYGPKKVILVGSVLLGAGLALCSSTRTWWQFYIFFGIITAAGVGATGWVPNTTIIQSWFKEKRGLAMGIISSGIGIGILICVPLIQHLINRVGWRMTYLVIAVSFPLIIAPMAILFLKRPPLSALSPYTGSEVLPPITKDELVVDKEWASRSWTVREAIGTKQFRLLGLAFFLGNFGTQSILTHHVVFLVDRGLEILFASYVVGMVGIVSTGGKILWGTLSDKIGREVTYTMGITCIVGGMIILILFNFLPFPVFPYFYALFFGMGYAVTASLPPIITADFFEGKSYGRIFGTAMMMTGLGAASGAWFAGFIHDHLKSYLCAFVITIVCVISACFFLWRAAPRRVRMVPGKRSKLGPRK